VPPSQLAEQAHDFTAARGTSPPIPITAVRGNVTQTIVCAPTIAGLVVAKAVPNRSETSSEASSLSSSVSSITSESCYRSNDHNIIAARQAIAMASDASKVYNQIIKIDPDNLAALYNKAMLCEAKNELADAVKLLERALKKDPSFAVAEAKIVELRSKLPKAG
jgi:tetratricopeptide (TPR) repeat protein